MFKRKKKKGQKEKLSKYDIGILDVGYNGNVKWLGNIL